MADIKRSHSNGRMSQMVIHGETIYLAGQVAAEGQSVTAQTEGILNQIDTLLAGADKPKIQMAQIWLDDRANFAEMTAVWDAWVPQGNEPGRAAGSAHLATPGFKVEIMITAAR